MSIAKGEHRTGQEELHLSDQTTSLSFACGLLRARLCLDDITEVLEYIDECLRHRPLSKHAKEAEGSGRPNRCLAEPRSIVLL